ncbi:GDSL-type esterase/lipase family protein [Rapidithrix thailandica]|uniref:GDSL-type esterase/lipase family protein n=1 Tax=Rapidithrix thailandica TaxID=413964 RepID=A0AAW9S6F0_9BACT
MKSITRILCTVFWGILALSLNAQSQHFLLGEEGNVTYAVAPASVKARLDAQAETREKAAVVLKRQGKPVFFASTPANKPGGAVLFNGKSDFYHTAQALGKASENFVLEVWVKARQEDEKDPYGLPLHVVLAHGDRKGGYLIAQQTNNWVLQVTGEKTMNIAKVTEGLWTHIALVADTKGNYIYVNGKKTASFSRTHKLNPNFSLGGLPHEKAFFFGEIYEARYTALSQAEADPEKAFLIDQQVMKRLSQQEVAQQKSLIQSLQTSGFQKKVQNSDHPQSFRNDWLISPVSQKAELTVVPAEDGLSAKMILGNGLVSRTFYVGENLACISYRNLSNGAEYLRAVKPEARVRLGEDWLEIGGLKGQPEKSYLLEEWLKDMQSSPEAFVFKGVTTAAPEARYPWKVKYNAVETDWPPKGVHIILHFETPSTRPAYAGINIEVHYELYDGLPVMSKWLTLKNNSGKEVLIEETECEVLAVNQDQVKRLHVESDFSFALVNAHPEGSALMHYQGEPKPYHAGQSTTQWEVDEEYSTWATHNQAEDMFLGFLHHNLLKSKLPMGPSVALKAGEDFRSFVTFELLHDSDDRERQSLGHRRMYRKLAPQVTESLLCGGITSQNKEKLKGFIDQMAELGFERLDVMAWPGISHNNLEADYVALWKEVAGYAKARGIVMGGYELQIASRGRGARYDVVDPATGKPGSLFGQSVCTASEWKDKYYSGMWQFFDQTGLMTYNMDGPYHGDPCASEEHPHHRGLNDSQWEQWKAQVEVLHELQKRDMYVPIPDWYFLNGQSATGMGYREASANLSPQQQLLLGRQYIYDGTWHKIPTMGWMGLQLVGFYTNDPRVGLEPLSENLDRYERGLVQHLGSGCQFTLRGNRLYDTPETKTMVKKWVDWFKQYREILTSDIIHVSRPSGRDLDCMFHVNPFIEHKGLAVIFNPTNQRIQKDFQLPVYYTGLTKQALVQNAEGKQAIYSIDAENNLHIPLDIPANGFTWVVIKDSEENAATGFIEKLENKGPVKIAALGTSLTGGTWPWMDVMKEWLKEEYPGQVTFHNEGVGASASSYPAESGGLAKVREVISQQPDVVFIEFAVNDAYTPYQISLKESEQNLREMVRQIKEASPSTQIILQTMNLVTDVPKKKMEEAAKRPELEKYYQVYRKVAQDENLLLIDHYYNWLKLFKEDRKQFLKYVPDGIHPNPDGYRAVLLPELKKALSGQIKEGQAAN